MGRDTVKNLRNNDGINIGFIPLLGLIMIIIALVGWGLKAGFLWDWSWAFIGLGAFLLTARLLSFNLIALALVPLGAMLVWVFAVM